jgi:hypothetical protein
MRRLLPLLLIPLAFSSVACPPTPTDPVKPKVNVKDDGKPPIEVPSLLKPRIEAALASVESRPLLTTNNFWTVFHGILGIGLEKTTLIDPVSRKKTNAIEYICAGGEIRGMQFLPTPHGLDVLTAEVFNPQTAGLQGIAQGHQDQFIAEMAQWGMPLEKKFKVGGKDFTFEDFTRHSKMRASVAKKQELSWAILVIAQYYGTDVAPWTNMSGEQIAYDDIVKYEANESIEQAACGGTHRLFGMTWAYHLHVKKGGKVTGPWLDVEARIAEFKAKARKMQNPDSSFSTDYFKSSANVNDPHVRIGTTGHIVEWLSLAMTDDELKEVWMQEAVSALARMILDMSRDEIESGALYHAAHGLHLYHARVFGTPPAYLALPVRKK